MNSLKDKIVLVTGAARGIGRGIADAFLREGCHLVLADLGEPQPADAATERDGGWSYSLASSEVLQTTVSELAAAHPNSKVAGVAVNVTSADSCAAAVAHTLTTFGRLDILVNNAGVVQSGPVDNFSEANWDQVFNVNTKGLFLMTRAALPALRAATPAAIINTASIAGLKGYPNMSAYCGSKFAAIGITQSLAAELAAQDIRVNAICPGMVGTAMWLEHLLPGGAGANNPDADFEELMRQMIPLGRPQTTLDMGEAAVFLASASNVTGIALPVAGGYEMS